MGYNYTAAPQLYEVAAVFPGLPVEGPGKGYRDFLENRLAPYLEQRYGEGAERQSMQRSGGVLERWRWEGPYSRVEAQLEATSAGENLKVLFASKRLSEGLAQQRDEAEEMRRRRKHKPMQD